MQYKKVSTESGVGQLPQLDQSFHPINLMRDESQSCVVFNSV